MIYKSLSLLVLFFLFAGMNRSNAQDQDLCPCIDAISDAVAAVLADTDCDGTGTYEAPKALAVHLAKLQNWCATPGSKPWKSKPTNIVQAMLETIEEAYAGEYYTNPLGGDPIMVNAPAPDCAWTNLEALKALLTDGCPVQP